MLADECKEATLKNHFKFGIVIVTTLFSLTTNARIPHSDHPATFLGPTARGSYTNPITDSTAYSIAGEVGLKNFRVSGTVGLRFAANERIKFSAEYLVQDITYAFFNGDTNQWVNQGAIGADYQMILNDYIFDPTIDLSGYYAYAPSKKLHAITGILINPVGISQTFVNARRISGSRASGAAPGLSITPWRGGKIGVLLNYDDVSYSTRFGRSKSANGFGSTGYLNQAIVENFQIGIMAAIREPFNNYSANLSWSNIPYLGNWVVSLTEAYTVGKNTLPNTYNVGLSVDYFVDNTCNTITHPVEKLQTVKTKNLKGDLKGEIPFIPPAGPEDDFVVWTGDPAVYMPQVLAVTDQAISTFCTQGIPQFIGLIANSSFNALSTQTINTFANFTGSGLIFSVSTTKTTPGGSSTVTINPTTGVLTATGLRSTTIVIVTAKNTCGGIASNAFSITFN